MWGTATRPPTPLETGYFFAHLFEADSHIPPAFSQSAFVVYCEKSLELPDGLAEGEVDELPDPPVVLLPDEVPEPVLPEVPEGLPEPELPDVPLPLPLPLPACAAAIAGAKAMIPTKNASITFCIVSPPVVELTGRVHSCGRSQREQYPGPRPPHVKHGRSATTGERPMRAPSSRPYWPR